MVAIKWSMATWLPLASGLVRRLLEALHGASYTLYDVYLRLFKASFRMGEYTGFTDIQTIIRTI